MVLIKHFFYAFVRCELSLLVFCFILSPFTIEVLRHQFLYELPFVTIGLSCIAALIYAILVSANEEVSK